MSIGTVVTQGYVLGGIPGVVLMGYSNGAEPPAPPLPEVAIPHFGGGPFTSRYGYDPRYYGDDEEREPIREAAIEALQSVEIPTKPEIAHAKREYLIAVEPIENAAKEAVRRIWAEEVKRRKLELEQEEAVSILLSLM